MDTREEKAETGIVWVVVKICFVNSLAFQLPEKYNVRLASEFCAVFHWYNR